MENLINSIGGYESWQFSALAFGLLSVGMVLRIKWVFMIPIPFFGLFLFFMHLNHETETAMLNISDPMIGGFASVMPLLFLVICIFVIIEPSVVPRMFGIHTSKPIEKEEERNDTKGA